MENKKETKKLGLQKIKVTKLNQNRLYVIKGGNPMLQTYTKEETGDCVYHTYACHDDNSADCQASNTCRSIERNFCENN